MSSMLPNATQAGTAAASPWKKRPKYTAMDEGTAAVITEKMQNMAEATMYSVRRPNVSDIGEQTMPPTVCPSKYIVTKAKTPSVLLMS